ncbi:hypothetical protein VCHA53O466_50348 [Vibrio chagasii]|nr:hypothetical protein VCHA53O466_50348 [Vibrio chagasii]
MNIIDLTVIAVQMLLKKDLSKLPEDIVVRHEISLDADYPSLIGWLMMENTSTEIAHMVKFTKNGCIVCTASKKQSEKMAELKGKDFPKNTELAIRSSINSAIISMEMVNLGEEGNYNDYYCMTKRPVEFWKKSLYNQSHTYAGSVNGYFNEDCTDKCVLTIYPASELEFISSTSEVLNFVNDLKVILNAIDADSGILLGDKVEEVFSAVVPREIHAGKVAKIKASFNTLYEFVRANSHTVDSPFVYNDSDDSLYMEEHPDLKEPMIKMLTLKHGGGDHCLTLCLKGGELYSYEVARDPEWFFQDLSPKATSNKMIFELAHSYTGCYNYPTLTSKINPSIESVIRDITSREPMAWRLKNGTLSDRGYNLSTQIDKTLGYALNAANAGAIFINPNDVDVTSPEYWKMRGAHYECNNAPTSLGRHMLYGAKTKWVDGSLMPTEGVFNVEPMIEYEGDQQTPYVHVSLLFNLWSTTAYKTLPDDITKEWWDACWYMINSIEVTYAACKEARKGGDYSALDNDMLELFKQLEDSAKVSILQGAKEFIEESKKSLTNKANAVKHPIPIFS